MTASTSLHSNALNFMSCLKSGVDPRTGLYNVSINLPELQGNDLRGPGITPNLSYSQLNTQDSGYGLGWSMQLSNYDLGTHILSLSTGETFCVDGTSDIRRIKRTLRTRSTKRTRSSTPADRAGQHKHSKRTRYSQCKTRVSHLRVGTLTMSEKKLDTFHFYRLDDTHFRVAHKSGLTELLQVHTSGNRKIAWPVQIFAPSGHSVRLEHKPFSSTTFRLASIRDDQDRILLNIDRSSNTVEVTLHPDAATENGPLARFVMYLSGSDKRVSRITLPTENEASWRFEYGFVNGDNLCIKRVDTPTGSHEEVRYDDKGHDFPASARRPALPRVTRHITDPGFAQPQVDVRYTYNDSQQRPRNFLGAGLDIYWEDNGLDNLFKYLGTYDYVCTESLWIDDQPVRSIERTFNRFHLQTREVTTQNDHRNTVETSYYIEEGVPYSRQPSYCQMPREIRTSWMLLKQPGRTRSETVSNTYDSHGNLLVKTRADGVVETNSWYPAEGVDGDCPPNAEGFVCQLKEQTITPAPSAQGGAPILSTRHRYIALPAIDGSDLPEWVVPDTETLVHVNADGKGNEVELQQNRALYFNQPDQPFLHGRVQRQSLRLNGQSTYSDYEYSKLDSPQLGLPVQQTTERLSTDFDSVASSAVRQLSLLTGQELLVEADGAQVRYTYDALNRLTREVTAPGNTFEASREYRYFLCANPGEQAEQVVINARKVMTRSLLDGLGRAIYEEQDHVDTGDPAAVRQIYAAQYSTWNNVEQETTYDYLDNQPLPLTRRFSYDDWNQQCVITDEDGVHRHQDLDPIGSLESGGPIQRNWVQSGAGTSLISERSEVWLNLFGKPTKSMSLNANADVVGTKSYLYDGLGRCTSQTDETQHTTLFSYDAWSRMTSTTLPDTCVIRRDYATHSSEELATALEVVHTDGTTRTLAGEQEFDGLLRLTRSTVGPRVERYAYEGGQKQIKTRTTAQGHDIHYTYNLAHTDQIMSSIAPDETADYVYDPQSARLTLARNGQGTRTYHYDALNRVQEEDWVDTNGGAWKARYSTSLRGRPLRRTELEKDGNPGLETLYRYDALGRIEGIEQGRLSVSVEYDGLGRPVGLVTRDMANVTALTTRLKYDDQGRETLRTQTLDGQPERTLLQIWKADGLLDSRHLQQGTDSLLKETFIYDERGRLTQHKCEGSRLPKDELGRAFNRQVFTFDALDNIKTTLTTFTEGDTERAMFKYQNDDPFQLSSVSYIPARSTPDPTFSYDDDGNQLNDELGQTLSYDSQARLLEVRDAGGQMISQYRYDSHDHLVASRAGSESEILRFYQDQQLSSSVQDQRCTQYLYLDEQPLGQQTMGDDEQTLLLLADQNNSVLGEYQQDTLRPITYSAYGHRHSDDPLLTTLGLNGEIREASTGWYLLGKGYRAYNPDLMRFHSPDSSSPFSAGGVNPYTYCLGNPIMLRDPTGHDASGQGGRMRRPDEGELYQESPGGAGLLGWTFVALGVVLTLGGFYATASTFGLAAPITAPVTALGISITATAAEAVTIGMLATGTALSAASTAVSAYAVSTGDEQAHEIATYLGYASIPFDLVGWAAKGTLKAAAKVAKKATKEANDTAWRNLMGVTNAAAETTAPATPPKILSSVSDTALERSKEATIQIPRVEVRGTRPKPVAPRRSGGLVMLRFLRKAEAAGRGASAANVNLNRTETKRFTLTPTISLLSRRFNARNTRI